MDDALGTSTREEHRFPCDQCGADYRYAPSSDQLTCDHCGKTEEIAQTSPWQAPIRELNFRDAVRGELDTAEIVEIRLLDCASCGAQIEFDEKLHATDCPFCATPVVTGTGTHRQIKPRALLPFQIDEGQARGAMNAWLGGLWFAPNGLQEYARKGRKMQGIYVPYWTYDADTKSRYSGERGTVYHESKYIMRGGEREKVTVQKVRWKPVSGRVARFFDDVLVLASKTLPKRYTDALEPWNLADLRPYAPEYLAGFRAEGYQVELEEGFIEARAQMDRAIARDVRFDIGGDRQRIHQIDTDIRDVTFKHVLLPVWLAAYKYRGDTYRFVVNGCTGKVQGDRPWSGIKIAIAVILGALVAGAVGYFIAMNQ